MTEPIDPAELRAQCARWNLTHAPGARMLYDGHVRTTSSIATVVGGHTAVVRLDGVPGPVPLVHVVEAPAGAHTDAELAQADRDGRLAAMERARDDELRQISADEARGKVWVAFAVAVAGVGIAAPFGASDLIGPHWLRSLLILLAGFAVSGVAVLVMRVKLVHLDELGGRRPWIFRTKAGGL